MKNLDAAVRTALTKLPRVLKGSKGAAIRLLQDDEATASAVFAALCILYKKNWQLWEAETVWLSLERNNGIDLSEKNRNNALAARNLLCVPSFR